MHRQLATRLWLQTKIVWVTVGISVSFASAAVPPAKDQGGFQSASVAICHIRPGREATVHETLAALGLGGRHLRADTLPQRHAGLEATLLTGVAERADAPVTWTSIDAAAAADVGLSRFLIVTGGDGVTADALVQALSEHVDLFEVVEADGPGAVLGSDGPNDPLFAAQYGLHNTGAPIGGNPGVPHADISALGAWAVAGGSPVTIAIVDTGVSQSHPDLASKLVPGWNFVGADPTATDDSVYVPHGTACAGIAAAAGNDAFGISGVSWNGRVMPVRVADIWGNSSESACANGIIWAVDHGARVISVCLF